MRFLCIDNKNDEHLTVGKIYDVFHSTNISQSNIDLYSIKTPYYVGDDGFSYVFIHSIHLGKTFVELDEIRDKKIIDLLNE
jgi:hypothetical protein